jgi:REP element-mobilizing transposase RayT
MPVRFQHDQFPNSVYFITFTCYKWKQLFSIAKAYDAVYKWFDSLYEKKISVFSYVIMPNHVHVLIHFPIMPKSLNTIIGTAKRFMAYEIIKNLEKNRRLYYLKNFTAA